MEDRALTFKAYEYKLRHFAKGENLLAGGCHPSILNVSKMGLLLKDKN